MIHLTRIDGSDVVVNADLIATIESTPDTVLALITTSRILVREPVDEVIRRVIAYRHRIGAGPGHHQQTSAHPAGPASQPPDPGPGPAKEG